MAENETGDSRVSICLTGVTEEQIEELSEAICDLLRDRGFGNRDAFRSIVIAEGWQWPASNVAAFVEEIKARVASSTSPTRGTPAEDAVSRRSDASLTAGEVVRRHTVDLFDQAPGPLISRHGHRD